MSDVFISYSRKDKDFVRRLFDSLESRGHDSWVDWEGIASAAPDFLAEIYGGIEQADTFLLIVTPESLKSEICNLEIAHAREHHKKIVPVIHTEVMDDGKLVGEVVQEWFGAEWEDTARKNWEVLSHINWLFFRPDDDYDEAFDGLVATLETDLEYVKFHTRLIVRAKEWQTAKEDMESRYEDFDAKSEYMYHSMMGVDFMLRGADLNEATAWLKFSDGKEPSPTELQREFIEASADFHNAETRRKHEEATRSSEMLNSIADGIIFADRSGRIEFCNAAVKSIIQISEEQILYRPINMLAGLLGRPGNVFAAIENWMDNPSEAWKETPFIEDTLQLHDGGTINVRVSPVIMGDSFLGTVYVYRDTTKEVEADRMKDQFVANVTHEFRTPITSVKGYIDLLLMGTAGEVSASQKPLLQSIKTDVDRLAALINDVLDLSRIDDATFEMSFKSVAVDRLFAGAADELQLKIDHAGRPMTVEVVPVDDMPPIRADLNRIQQIIRILLDNAFNYTPENGHIRLSATHDVDTEEVILTVADDGRGMPEEMHPRVFERFFRGEDYDAQIADTPGTGLGLAIAKSLTEAQNGSISFESKLGEGSTFYVRMPALTED